MATPRWQKYLAGGWALCLFLWGTLCFGLCYGFLLGPTIRIRHEQAYLSFEIDLSQPGEFSYRIPKGDERSEYRQILLKTQPLFESAADALAALEGFSARLKIIGRTGQTEYEQTVGPEAFRPTQQFSLEDHWVPVISDYDCSVRAGDTLQITVLQGASRLSGIPQSLVVEHEYPFVCGMFVIAVISAWFMGIICYLCAGDIFSRAALENSRWPWGRIFPTITGMVVLSVAVVLFYQGYQSQCDADRALSVEPLRFDVDLSRPGVYHGDFKCAFPFHMLVSLETQPSFASKQEGRTALKGIAGHLAIYFPDGRTVYEGDLTARDSFDDDGDANGSPSVPIAAYYGPLCDDAVYRIRLKVEEGAERMANLQQTVVVCHGPSQRLYERSQILYSTGCIVGGMAGVIFLGVLVVTIFKRWRKAALAARGA